MILDILVDWIGCICYYSFGIFKYLFIAKIIVYFYFYTSNSFWCQAYIQWTGKFSKFLCAGIIQIT